MIDALETMTSFLHVRGRRASSQCVALALALLVGAAPKAGEAASRAPPAADETGVETADEHGTDEVLLRDGGFVRGTLIEVVPDAYVVIAVGGRDEHRRISYEAIESIERGKHAAVDGTPTRDEDRSSTPADQRDEPPTEPKLERGKPRVHLHTTRDRPVKLFVIDSALQGGGVHGATYTASYRSVCASPCGQVIDATAGSSFFVGQDVWTASSRFGLDEYAGDLHISVRPGNKAMRIIGAVLLGIGMGAAIAGGVFVANENTRKAGVGLLASGVIGISIGTPMLVLGRARYEIVKPQK